MSPTCAKTLIPGAHPVPALLCATPDAPVLLPQLLDRGWGPFSARLPDAPGEVIISSGRLQLVVEGQLLLDDVNPTAPRGWWTAVDRLDTCCVVVITTDTDLDLSDPRVGEQVADLLGTDRAVFAALRVRTDLPD